MSKKDYKHQMILLLAVSLLVRCIVAALTELETTRYITGHMHYTRTGVTLIILLW
jgi:hypothetical protein